VYSATPALKYYDYVTNNWIGITNANLPVYDSLGYMLFVRGDRSVTFPNFNNTTLRTKGTLIMGATTPIKVKGGKFQSIGNPYAAEVDIRKIKSTNINADIIIWDPTLTTGSQYGLGAYQTLYKNGANYVNLLESPAYGPAGTINNNISSGLAFFVQSFKDDGQVYFTEDAKAPEAGKGIAMRQQAVTNNAISLQANLYGVNANGTTFITDGVMQQFGSEYSNNIDNNDARKLANTSENLSILSQGVSLVIERRNLPTESDTISYNLTGVVNQNYRFVFNASGLENAGINGFVEDTYTKTRTALNLDGNTEVDFTVDGVAGSKAANRFRIVFQQMRVMPVTFTSVKATSKNATVAVEWKVENQSKLQQYEVEKSSDGSQFTKVASIAANNNASSVYSWTDENPVAGNNYYRIRSVDLNGATAYTSIVKAEIVKINGQMKVYPNPAVDAKVSLELNNAPAGVYYARLFNPLGQVIVSQKIVHQAGTSTETIKWNNAAARGIYQLEIAKPDGNIETVKVVY
ncbi:MAG: T9SS type A sorting domain-containing protein, partial [Ginsengibacter sp.]